MKRDSVKARRTCLDTHARRDAMGVYMVCHVCGGRINPPIDKWRADHIRRHAEGGTETADNLWPIHLKCDVGPDGKAAADTRSVAKGKRMGERHFGLRDKRGGFRGYRKFNGDLVWKDGR